MNKWIGMGNLTKDPEVMTASSGLKIASYTLAINSANNTEFIDLKAFDKNAEFAEKYLHKGTKILVEAHLHKNVYENSEGKKIYSTEIIADRHEFCESKKESSGFSAIAAPVELDDGIEEELPFL